MFNLGPLTAEDRMMRGKIILQRNHPFFAYIIMHFELRQTCGTDLPTMGVNEFGDLYWNPDFVNELTEDALLYVLCHETMHIAKCDKRRQGSRDHFIWNIACDCVINDLLNLEGFIPPKWTAALLAADPEAVKGENPPKPGDTMGLIPDKNGNITIANKSYKIRGKTSEEVYDDLIEDMKVIRISICGASGDGQGNGDNQSGEGEGKGPNKDGYHGGFDRHLKADSDEKGESNGKSTGQTSINKQESRWGKVVVEATIQAKEKGSLPGFADQMVTDILEPKVDWRNRVRSMITNEIPFDFETRLPGRSFYTTRAWCPRMIKENVNLMISIDCSGSTMGDREKFMSEIQGIVCAHSNVHARLICWDTRVDPANDIEVDTQTVDKLKQLKLSNINGGTELSAYCDYVEEKGYSSRVHIHLTDGYIEHNPRLPSGQHLFVLCGTATDDILKDYGECIYIKDQYDEG